MTDWHLTTPVAFLIFNRPETTAQVFMAIRKAKPAKLLVIADGPRPDRPDDNEKCASVRTIIEQVDWPCEILKNYSEVNLGCKRRVVSGLNWVFDNVEEAIILEDDCLPDATFFRFCDELLIKYRDDERIMMISGDNFLFDREKTPYSYYYSCHAHIWGWASWRRAWKFYDAAMSQWPEIKKTGRLYEWFHTKKSVRYWTALFDKAYLGKINTWDYQWNFACRVRQGMIILPQVNLVSNIGFGFGATHTDAKSIFAHMNVEPIKFPLLHPPHMSYARVNDDYTEAIMYSGRSFFSKVLNKLKKYLP